MESRLRAAEFFAGIGLVRRALEGVGVDVVWANDVDETKCFLYAQNFGSSHLTPGDIRSIPGESIPSVDVATASFPCTDLSLAGDRKGFSGRESGLFLEFARIISEMDVRKPRYLLIENVPGFATANGGQDIDLAIRLLNNLGYSIDIFSVDAQHFVPQSRQRLFLAALLDSEATEGLPTLSQLRPEYVRKIYRRNAEMKLVIHDFPDLPTNERDLSGFVERLSFRNDVWWSEERVSAFCESLSETNAERLRRLRNEPRLTWRTAFRRTRGGNAVWEIRPDAIAGCLRAVRGGSSKQAIVEAGRGHVRVRWMSANEYGMLQGADGHSHKGVSHVQAAYGYGDAVCVPAVNWILANHAIPFLESGSVSSAPDVQLDLLHAG